MEKFDLELELKNKLIASLNLEEITAQDIDSSAPLFGDGLGLDSIDALEIIIMLEKDYGIRFDNPKDAKEVFFSISTIAQYVIENQK